jgi:hypothetical protein
MKISKDTINVLQNFASINNGLLVGTGNTLKTISPSKTLLASAEVSETFDTKFCIYDLAQFLGTVSLFDSPDFEFGDNSVEISEGETNLVYVYADPNTIVTVPGKKLECESDIAFDLPWVDFDRLQKAANVLGLPNLVIAAESSRAGVPRKPSQLVAMATDVKNSTSNNFKINLDSSRRTGDEFSFKAVIKFDNLKFLPDDYHVSISTKGVSLFTGNRAEYFVAVEQNDSEFKNI